VAVGWLTPAPWLAAHWPRALGVGLLQAVAGVAVTAAVVAAWQRLDDGPGVEVCQA
jgi:hypothetical protein